MISNLDFFGHDAYRTLCPETGKEEMVFMHSEAYLEAKKEFINCLCMSLIGVGIPLILAFKEWLPIMREEKKKEMQ